MTKSAQQEKVLANRQKQIEVQQMRFKREQLTEKLKQLELLGQIH